VVTLVARNANDMMGSGSLRSAGERSVESGGWFYFGAFGRNMVSVTVKLFSH
jgi:hypothetical protein